MVDKLTIWNKALRHIGEGRLRTLTDDVEARYVLEDSWPTIVVDGLSRGDWNFAIKRAEIPQSTTSTPTIGYQFAYDHPADWLRTLAYSPLADFKHTYLYAGDLDVVDQAEVWSTNLSQFFVEYISTDFVADDKIETYPPSYVEFLAALLARDITERITQGSTKISYLDQQIKIKLLKAKSNDARNQKETEVRPGKWARALRGYARRRGIGTLVGGQIQTGREDL